MKIFYTLLLLTFFGLNHINSATFSSVSSGTWSAPATWTITSGTDADGIPDLDDDLTINSGHNISMISIAQAAKSILNNGILTGNGKKLNLYGNFTNNGNVSGLVLYVQGVCVFSSSVFFNGATWLVYKPLTITPGTSIFSPQPFVVNSTVNNLGSVNVNGRVSTNSAGTWINGAASNLTVTANFNAVGVLDASGIGNTITYLTSQSNQIKNSTYYNLILGSVASTTRTAQGNLTILNNLTIGSGTGHVFNMNNFNLTVGGNWLNQSSSNVINQATVTFNTSTSQTISRTSAGNEVFNNMIIGGSGTTALGKAITVNQNLTLSSGLLDVTASNFSIDIKGNLTNNAAINCRQGLVSFTGSSPQTISGTQGTSFNDLTTANGAGVTVLSNVAVFYILRVNSGSFGTSGSGIITIPASGPTTYARIANVGGSLFGTGWALESYINGPAQAGWQWLSSPINGNLLADWDNDTRFYMSGVGGNDGNAGSFQSVRTYNESTGLYTSVTTTTTPLTAGLGFQIWMSDDMTGLTSPLVYNSTGTPNFGTINFPVTAGGAGSGYNLVGNPYACPLDYSAVVAASGNLYSSFIVLQEDNTYATDPNSGIIAPNQGFMCCAFANGNITFTEACKNINGNPNILKTSPQNNAITFSVYNNVNGIGGRTFINFTDDATDNFENGTDLAFLTSPSEEADNIYTKSKDEFALLRNRLPNNGEEKYVPLTVKPGVFGSHFISVKGLSNLDLYNSVWLEDLTTGKKVDLLKNSEYEFNTEEIGTDYEFLVHFSNTKKSTENTGITNANLLNENTSVFNTPSNVVVKFSMNESTPVSISVYNLAGQKVMETINTNVIDDRIALPLQKQNGLYLLLIQSGDEQITRKIIY